MANGTVLNIALRLCKCVHAYVVVSIYSCRRYGGIGGT